MIKVIKSLPPNYEAIKQSGLKTNDNTVYCYGDKIYAPNCDPYPDVIYHESIHSKQQGDNPEAWWQRYLNDSGFRFEQELEAFAGQYNFVKKNTDARYAKQSLEEISEVMASEQYQFGITRYQVSSLIRHYK